MNIQDVFLRLQGNTGPIHIIEMDGKRTAMTYSDLVADAKVFAGRIPGSGNPGGGPAGPSIAAAFGRPSPACGGPFLAVIYRLFWPSPGMRHPGHFEKALESLEAPWVITDHGDSAGASGKGSCPCGPHPGGSVSGGNRAGRRSGDHAQFTSGTTRLPPEPPS